jgi:cob(I)alamin adenosyltransferase
LLKYALSVKGRKIMADSDQDKQADSAFDDDLEKMLQDNTEQLSDDEEVLDDKEAIDQLLDENPGQLAADDIAPESVDDIVDSLLDDVASGQGQEANELTAEELDEFAEDPLEHLTDVSSDDIDQLLQSSDSSEPESIDEFVDEFAEEPGPVENLSELDAELTDDTEVAEASQVVADTSIDADLDIDEFAEEEPSIDVNIEPEPATEPELARPAEAPAESMTEIDEFAESEDDFLMADFDISADESEEPVAQENYASLADEPESTRVMPAEPAAQLVDSAEMQAMSERLEKLENELADYSQSSSNDKAAEQNEVLEKSLNSQKKILRETAEASGKLKILSISSLVIGVLALIIGVVVLVMTMEVPAELEEVQNTIMDIEDGLAVPDPNTQTIQALQTTVGELQAENVKLTTTLTQLEQQIADNKKQSIALLKADLAQQLLEITGQLSALEEKVAKTRVVQQRVTSTRKIARKPKVQEWVVNLVSFKQRWYTDNKVAEFKKKGIPAEVLAVDIGGVEWYRIRVVGFKDKMAAGSYAVKIKKSLNLSSVWVSAK